MLRMASRDREWARHKENTLHDQTGREMASCAVGCNRLPVPLGQGSAVTPTARKGKKKRW